jgi:hypothetical protein
MQPEAVEQRKPPMVRTFTVVAMFAAMTAPASAQGFTVINDRGGSVERGRTIGGGELDRSVARTTAAGRTAGREVSLEKTGVGEAKRTVTATGPRGRQNTRSATITRN